MDLEILDENATYSDNTDYGFDYYYHNSLFKTICYMIVSLVCLISNGIIIDVIVSSPQLRTTRNILILNWAVCDFLFMVFEPSKFAIVMYHTGSHIYGDFYFIISGFHMLMQFCVLFFIYIMFVNCLYKRLTVEKLLRIIPFIWIMIGIVTVSIIITFRYNIFFFADMITFFAFLLVMLTYLVKTCLYFYRRVRSKEKKYHVRYILTTSYISCWFFSGFFIFLGYYMQRHSVTEIILENIGWMFILIAHLNSCIQIVLLNYFDVNFKINFTKRISQYKTCCKKSPYEVNV